MELSGRDSLSIGSWGLDDDQLHGLPLMEGDSDLFNSSMESAGPILDHDDVNSLFPMLSDSSFEYEGDQQLSIGGGDPELPPFESDLSPIFAAKTTPLAIKRESLGSSASKAGVTLRPKQEAVTGRLTPRSKRKQDSATPKSESTTSTATSHSDRPTSASRTQRKALTPVKSTIAKTPEPRSNDSNNRFLTPVRSEQELHSSSTGAAKRRRSSSIAKLPALSTNWNEQEQSAFFSIFKNKWPVDEDAATTTRSPSFSTLLLQRFDAISKKIRTKTLIEVRLFYTIVLSSISGLLKELENDVDLTNPDQVRIAVWCWSKLLTDESHKKDFLNVATADPSVKKRLAHVLLQSIIRSRRQMLKAKCTHGFLYNSISPSAAAALVVASPKPKTSVFSVFKPAPAKPVASNANAVEPVVHHPLVRKKARTAVATPLQSLVAQPAALSPQQQQQQQQAFIKSEPTSAVKSALKRKRGTDSTASSEVDETPLKAKRQQLAASMEASSFVSPAPTTGLSQQHQMKREHQSHITSQTPPQSSRKKIYIKMRIVPMDKAAKAHVVSSGCNPKVELKLTSTKRISEVAHHMAKKWEKARAFVPADAILQFYESQVVAEDDDNNNVDRKDASGEATGGGWSAKDRSVTCFDIWKRCGKKSKNENVVVVYYAWKALDSAARHRKLTGGSSGRSEVDDDIDVLSDDIAHSPGSLFAEEISLADLGASSLAGSLAVASSTSRNSTSSLARGLQQFGESMAFHSSEFSDAALWKNEEEALSKAAKLSKNAACPLDALLDENDEDEEIEGGGDQADAFVDCSPDTQRLRRRITPMLMAKEEFDL